MAFDPRRALREAGIASDPIPEEVERALASLTKEETDLLISLKSRIPAIVPEVLAHSVDGGWSKPEAAQHGYDAAMLCACGAWSGSGSDSN
ncbi:StsA-related sactipeptide RiPP [Sphaerisporangium dianthi]|uniref:StsA-related sactipeptide RiPP n=1 Tax=Sphaerisporangium dianthi TaxID=1436120 RepID=A0ABV9CK11_9ACTN